MTDNEISQLKGLLPSIRNIIDDKRGRDEKLQMICDFLRKAISGYDWVGFYFVDPQKARELVLGPFAGESTEHIRIPFGRGICGQAADRGTSIIVDDVKNETNYLACSLKVRSEIVLPLYKNAELIGELDLDSHTPGRFNKQDEEFLSEVCKIVSELF